MSPSRTPYRHQRPRREVIAAVLSVAAVLMITGIMVWILAPTTEEPPVFPTPVIDQPLPQEPTDTTAPPQPTDTTAPAPAPEPDSAPSVTPPPG